MPAALKPLIDGNLSEWTFPYWIDTAANFVPRYALTSEAAEHKERLKRARGDKVCGLATHKPQLSLPGRCMAGRDACL